MKILQVGKYYPPYHGGMETVLENLVQGLLDAGVQVNTLVSGEDSHDRHETIWGPISGNEGSLVRATRVGQFHSQPMNTTLVSLLRRELISFQPDLVHLHLPNPLALMAWSVVGRILGHRRPPFVIWHHADITRQKIAGQLVKPLLGHCYHHSAGICVSSRALLSNSSLLQNYSSIVKVIPFGIENEPWGSLQPSRNGPFLFVGRLVAYKGISVLLDALKMIPEAKLDIVGVGPLKKDLDREIQRDGLSDRVVFHGSCDSSRLAQLMGNARALILPSLDQSETFGLVQLEAMASGIAVIASNLGSGVAEVGIDGETCLLVTPGNAPLLADSMKKLLQDDKLAAVMGEAARLRFTEHFTRQKMTTQVVSWYESLLARHHSENHSINHSEGHS